MATSTYSYPTGTSQAQPQARTSPCAPPPTCPVCGGLECLCRPRFFAGQILTDDDLNQLEGYVVKKNRLHNRYLHGWGVVCGLEVSCSPCTDRVTVQSGYALSPCGDDIIVCNTDTAMICDLIKECTPAQPILNCLQPSSGNNNDCSNLPQDWILAICYNETASRGITPLRGPTSSGSCQCGCGGGSSTSSNGKAGCGCKSNPNAAASSAKTSASPQCEPTLTCEGYSFAVYPAPTPTPQTISLAGQIIPLPSDPLSANVITCAACLLNSMPPAPTSPNQTAADWQKYCCALKHWMTQQVKSMRSTDCQLLTEICQLQCPNAGDFPDAKSYQAAMNKVLRPVVLEVVGHLLRDCFCGALLPPCPAPVDCNCVPLATLSVQMQTHTQDCTVLSVCNWGPRRLVMTFPDLFYWLGPTHIFDALRAALEAACCGEFRERGLEFFTFAGLARGNAAAGANASAAAGGSGSANAARGATANPNVNPAPAHPAADANAAAGGAPPNAVTSTSADTAVAPFATLLSQSWLNASRQIDAGMLALALAGIDPFKSSVTPLEQANPAAFLCINQLFQPTFRNTMPPEWTTALTNLAQQADQGSAGANAGVGRAAPVAGAPAAPAGDVAALQKNVADLQTAVETLQKQLAQKPSKP